MEETPKLSTKVKLNEQEYKITDFENGKKICLKGTEEENINDDIAILRGKEDTIMTYHSRMFGDEFKEYGGASALDNTSEKHIQQEIEAMKAECGTTVISIAHRLTTLQNCDEILVMDQGRIVQRGTFRQLEETPGIFRDMARGILK